MSLVGDYEHQLRRDLSVHAGFRRRYTGWNFETEYAGHSSSRVAPNAAGVDVRFPFNMNPFFVGMRPQLALAKVGKLDFRVQLGADFEVQKYASPRLLSGINFLSCSGPSVGIW